MLLKQYYLSCLHASYPIGNERTRRAAVVDPQRDIQQYLHDAPEHAFESCHILLRSSTRSSLLGILSGEIGPANFAGAHLAGSLNIGLGGKFATWGGTMLDREHPIAASVWAQHGFMQVMDLVGGFDAWEKARGNPLPADVTRKETCP